MRAIVLASTALVLIPGPALAQSLSVSDVSCTEGQSCPVTISRSGSKGSTASFIYKTVNGEAASGYDYVGKSGQQSVRKNATKITINVGTIDDATVEQTEKLYFDIVPIGGVTVTKARGVITILDNDVAAPAPAPVPTPAPAPEPVPAPAPAPAPSPRDAAIAAAKAAEVYTADGYLLAPSLAGLPDIPDAFPSEEGAPDSGIIQPSTGESKYRGICGGDGQVLADDMIMFPDQPGKSHWHQWYGVKGANAFSTYVSLRLASGKDTSTCNNTTKMLNTSAYWKALMIWTKPDGSKWGVRARPIVIYYSRAPIGDPSCDRTKIHPVYKIPGMGKECVPVPQGLRIIFGFNWDRPPATAAEEQGLLGARNWTCDGPSHSNILDALRDPGCKIGTSELVENLVSPPCWNPKYLDTPDHRSHMAYPSYGSWGYLACPAGYDEVTVSLGLKSMYKTGEWMVNRDVAGAIASLNIGMSCDHMAMGKPAGYCSHGDWVPSWSRYGLDQMEAGCLSARRPMCNVGDLGTGRVLLGNYPVAMTDAEAFFLLPPTN